MATFIRLSEFEFPLHLWSQLSINVPLGKAAWWLKYLIVGIHVGRPDGVLVSWLQPVQTWQYLVSKTPVFPSWLSNKSICKKKNLHNKIKAFLKSFLKYPLNTSMCVPVYLSVYISERECDSCLVICLVIRIPKLFIGVLYLLWLLIPAPCYYRHWKTASLIQVIGFLSTQQCIWFTYQHTCFAGNFKWINKWWLSHLPWQMVLFQVNTKIKGKKIPNELCNLPTSYRH